MLFRTILLCVFLITGDGDQQPSVPTLPSLSYWQLLERLEIDGTLEKRLGVTPSQISKIRELRAQGKFEKLQDDLLDKQTAEGRFVFLQDVWLEMDPAIYEELSGILTEQQLEMFRPIGLRSKLAGPLSCFTDREILDFIGMKSPTSSLASTLEKEQAKLDLAVKQLMKECLSEIHATLTPPSSELLRRYCGNFEYSKLDKLEDVDSIPYGIGTISDGVYFYSQNVELPDNIKLSERQKSELREIKQSSARVLPLTSSQKEFDIAYTQWAKKFRQPLRQEQYVFLVQLAARNGLCQNFRKAFERKELLDFLEIEAVDMASVQEAAEKQTRRMSLEMDRLNEVAFQNVANSLPIKQREKLLALFNGGWVYRNR